jgi:GR25 family glycosyltransferase involved in LPS biosynthesis
MLLITRITKSQLNYYREEFLQCLKHNSSNSYINQIIVYTDEFKHNISTSKTKVIFKRIIAEEIDIIKESKKTWINKIILSNPFVKFNEDLYKIIDKDLETKVYQNSNYTIFSKNSKISNNGDFELEKSHINIKTEKINTTKKEILKLEENKNDQIGNVLVKKSTFDPNKISSTTRKKKIDVIIVSVNYNDYLLLSLISNTKIFNNITVVTVDSDKLCQNICKNLGVNCIISERIYENGAKFNKGKAINDAINSLENPDLILLLDADIIVKGKIEISELSDDVLYTSDRIIYKNYESFISETEYLEEIDKGFGFFQLFCYNNPVINKYCVFPESSDTAEGSDIEFRDKFSLKRSIGKKIIHLGETRENWKGRTTKKFISDKLFNKLLKENTFNINEYFDKIYCLNLDRRPDRWIKVSEEFKKFNIDVERVSAIDGLLLEDSLLCEYNNKNLSESESSELGILENKNALACLLSHLEILKKSKELNHKKILIFEDDIKINDNFIKKVNLIKEVDWKLIYLGCSQFNKSGLEHIDNFYLSKDSLGTFAYAIDISIYEELLELHNKHKDKSIDNLLSIFQKENVGNCYTIEPNIVITDNNESDIRNRQVLVKSFRDDKIVPKLAVITTFFNPNNYVNLKYNYLTFSKKIKEKCDLFTIELSYDNNFFIEDENVVRIKGNETNILWQKERLLNILLEKVPQEYTNIAWVDCDIIFENENWVNDVNQKLQEYKILQLFEKAKRLNKDGNIGLVSKSIVKVSSDLNRIEDSLSTGITGFAWAGRREVLEKINFLDTQIIGGADALMYYSFVNKKNTITHKKMNPEWIKVYKEWHKKSLTEVNHSINFISGDIIHLYHGEQKNRNYNNRYEILNKEGFNPEIDLILDKNNLWKFKNVMLSQKMSEYFESRDEDDNIIDINSYFDKIYVLNLKRRPDRWKNIKSKLTKLKINFERFNAVDGEKLDIDYDFSNFKPGKGMLENKYAYACLLSHFEIIKDAKEKNYKRILIFEDDVLISKDIKAHLQKIRNIKDWKLLYLGASQYNWNVDFIDDFYLSKKSLGTFAYAVDSSIYDDILNLDISKSVDNLLSDIQSKYYGECFTFYPNICTSDVTESDIRDNRVQEEHSIKMKWNILNYV